MILRGRAMKKKKWLKYTIELSSILLIIDISASFYFYNMAIARNVKDFLQGNADLEVSAEALDVFLEGDWRTWVEEQPFETMEIKSHDGLKLAGYFLQAKEKTNKTVVFSHGYLGRGSDMGLYGQYFYENLGYNVFFADARGHGQSEGDYIGFGWHDRLDYLDWLDVLLEKLGPDTEFILHGVSMGAATVLMMSGENLPQQVKGIIADSPYSSVYELFAYQMKRMYNLPAAPILPTTSLVTKIKADYTLTEASALDQVKKATVPILYIHGNADTFVPTEMTKELFEQTKSKAEILLVDEAGHSESFVTAKEDYINKLNEFLQQVY